jgi:hypothetical protein
MGYIFNTSHQMPNYQGISDMEVTGCISAHPPCSLSSMYDPVTLTWLPTRPTQQLVREKASSDLPVFVFQLITGCIV